MTVKTLRQLTNFDENLSCIEVRSNRMILWILPLALILSMYRADSGTIVVHNIAERRNEMRVVDKDN